MVDVRLITIIPPPTAVSQPSSSPGVTTQGATIQPQLPTGSVLSGFIINRDPTGNPILRTPSGDVVFSSNFFLKIGSEVVIRLQPNTGGNVNARILSVNGLSPEIATNQSSFARDSNVIVSGNNPQTQSSAASAAPSAAPPAIGSNLSAIVVIPTQQTAIATPQSPAFTPGTSLLLSVLGVNTPAPAGNVTNALSQLSASPQSTASPSGNALSNLLPETTTTTISAPAPAPTTQAPLPNTPITPSPQIAASTQAAAQAELPQALAQTIIANVASTSEGGRATLSSTLGTLSAVNVPGVKAGDQLTLRVDSVGQSNSYTIAVANNAQTPPLTPLIALSRSWPSMQFILQLLGGDDALTQLPNMPQLSAKAGVATNFGGQVLSYVSAIKTGNFRDWLGRGNIAALEDKGYGALIRKAEGEFLSIARQFNEPQQGQWQSLFFPVAVAGEVPQVRAFIKREKKKNEQDKPTGEEDTRFILEMELSQLGELQMDGLVKRKDDQLKFDLIIRSHEPLPKDVTRDIEQIYRNTAELTEYNGQISFQTVHTFPVSPLEETLPSLVSDVIA